MMFFHLEQLPYQGFFRLVMEPKSCMEGMNLGFEGYNGQPNTQGLLLLEQLTHKFSIPL